MCFVSFPLTVGSTPAPSPISLWWLNGFLVASLRLSGTNGRHVLCALTARPRGYSSPPLVHHAAIKALQPAPREPNIWNRALDQRGATKSPADAEGQIHFSSRCSTATVMKMSGDARTPTRCSPECSKCFARIYLFNKNGTSRNLLSC